MLEDQGVLSPVCPSALCSVQCHIPCPLVTVAHHRSPRLEPVNLLHKGTMGCFLFHHLIIFFLDDGTHQLAPCQEKTQTVAGGVTATEVSAQSPGGKRQREPLCGQMLSVGGPLGGNRRSAIHPLQSTEGYNSCSVGSWGRRICLNKTTGLSEWERHSQRLWAPSKDIQIDNHLVSGQSTDKI